MADYDPQRRRRRSTPKAGNSEAVEDLLGPPLSTNGNSAPKKAAAKKAAAKKAAPKKAAPKKAAPKKTAAKTPPSAEKPGADEARAQPRSSPADASSGDSATAPPSDPLARGLEQLVELASRTGCLGFVMRFLGRTPD